MKSSHSYIHFKYWIAILVAIIIVLIAEKWSDSQLFTTYLSNAATLTSLLLGLVAIFYAYISNESISTSLGRVEGLSRGLEEIKSQIESELIESNKTADKLSSFAETLSSLTSALNQNISKLPQAVESLKDESIRLQEKVQSMDASLGSLCDSFADNATERTPPGHPSQSRQNAAEDATFARNLLERSNISLSTILVVLSLYQKSARNGAFAIREIAGICNSPATVVMSYLGFLSGIGLLSLRFGNKSSRSTSSIEITYLHSVLANESIDHLQKLLNASQAESGGLNCTALIEEVRSALS